MSGLDNILEVLAATNTNYVTEAVVSLGLSSTKTGSIWISWNLLWLPMLGLCMDISDEIEVATTDETTI